MNTTISFQADAETKQILDQLALQEGVSRSDVLRQLLKRQRFSLALGEFQRDMRTYLAKHNLETEDDFEALLG